MNEATFMQWLSEMGKVGLREAMTRSEYNDFMTRGIKGLLAGAYAAAALETTWRELVTEDTSSAKLENYPSIGDPAMPRQVLEGERFENLSPGSQDNVAVTSYKYGGIIELSTEADEDDQSPGKELGKQGLALGRKHEEYHDTVFYSILTGNAAIYDTQNFFSLNHPGYTGGATRAVNDNIYTGVTMSANALATVLGIIAQWEGADVAQRLQIRAERVVCPATLQQTALGLTNADLLPFAYAAGALGPAATVSGGMPNAMKGKFKVTSSPILDATSTTDWYVKTNFPGLLHLKRKGLTLIQEHPASGKSFEQGLLRWRTEERFRGKVINWRWGALIS